MLSLSAWGQRDDERRLASARDPRAISSGAWRGPSVRTISLPYFVDRSLLDADLHLPEDGRPPYPVVVACSGYQGRKRIHPERFARALTPRGFAVLAIEYRGQGESEGERGRFVPQEQAEDVRGAVDRLMTVEEVDAARVALLGWGMGGGVVIAAAAEDPRARAVVALNAFGDGERALHTTHDDRSWRSLLERVDLDRTRRAVTGRSERTAPWDVVRLDLDPATDSYVADDLYRGLDQGAGTVTLESAEWMLRFRPERVVSQIAPHPLLVVHGARNGLHRLGEAEALYRLAGEPKELLVLEDAGHTEWMFDDHPTFRRVVERVARFLGESLPRHSRTTESG